MDLIKQTLENAQNKKIEDINNSFNLIYNWLDGQKDFNINESKKLSEQFKVLSNAREQGDNMIVYGYKATLRSDGRYMLKPTINGKQISIYGEDKDELRVKFKILMLKNERKEQKKFGSFFEWYNKWLEVYKKPRQRESTYNQTVRTCNRYISSLFKLNIEELTPVIIQNLLIKIDSSRTRERIKVYLKDCLNKAYCNNIITNNPMLAVEVPKHKKQHYQSMDKETEDLFISEVLKDKYKNATPILLCLFQGLRIGESLALTWEDFNFENKTLTINKSRRQKTVGKTKTDTSNRVMPLFDITIEYLNTLDKTKPLYNKTYTAVFKSFHNIIDNNSKFKGLVLHSLRHTFATRCIEKGIMPKVLAKWLGHSTTVMTMEVYTHVNNDFEKQQIDLINKKE